MKAPLLLCCILLLVEGLQAQPPTLTSPLTPGPVCSGGPFLYVPASASPQTGYTWSRAAVAGISNPAATGEGAVDETLINTTNLPITVTYLYTLYFQGATNTQQVSVVVNPIPAVQFSTPNLTQCSNGNSFTMTNLTAGAQTYQWSFGDGTTSTLQSPAHNFGGAGVYPITLTATSAAGCSSSFSQNVTVNESPLVNFNMEVENQNAFNYTMVFGQQSEVGSTTFTSASLILNGNTFNPGINFASYQAQTGNVFGISINAQLTMTTAQGCTGTAFQSITVQTMNYGSGVPFIVSNTNGGANAVNPGYCLGTTVWFTDNTNLAPANPPYTYTWYFGDANNSIATGTNVSFTYSTPGTYIVTEVISNDGGLAATSTARTITIYPNVTSLTLTPATTAINLCTGQASQPIYFGPMDQGITYSWSLGGFNAGASQAPFPGATYFPAFTATPNASTVPRTENMIVSATSPYGCGIARQNILITDNPLPNITGNYPTQTVCSGSTVTGYNLTATPAGTSFTWTNSDPVTGLLGPGSGNIPPFTGTTYAPAPETSIVMVTASLNGCSSATSYTYVVDPEPLLTSNLAPAAMCSGQAFVYTPASTTAGLSFTWSRPGEPGLANPAATGIGAIDETLTDQLQTALDVPYSYTLSANGCTNTQTVDVTVNPQPVINLPVGADQTLCTGSFSNAVALGSGVAGANFTWVNDNPAVGLVASGSGDIPSFQGTNGGNTPISATLQISAQTPAGCSDATPASLVIVVNPAQAAVVTAPDGQLLCMGNVLPLQATGADGYQWYLNGMAISGGTNSILDVTNPGSYLVTAISSNGCRDSSAASTDITLIPTPNLSFSFISPDCVKQPVLFNNASTEGDGMILNFKWYDSRGDSSTAGSPSFTYDSAGTVAVTLVAFPQGCATSADTLTQLLTIVPPIPGMQLAEVDAVAGQPVQLNVPAVSGVEFSWSPATGLSGDTISDPVATLTVSQQYYITLNPNSACSSTDTLLVRVIPKDLVYIPNAFTPNGDNHNDRFVIVGINNYPGSKLEVFDRWGKEVYFSANYQNDWDGGIQPVGTYVYALLLNTGNGTKLYKGFVVLIR